MTRTAFLAASLLLAALPAAAGAPVPAEGPMVAFAVSGAEAFLSYGGPGDRKAWEGRLRAVADAEAVRGMGEALDASGNGAARLRTLRVGETAVGEAAPGIFTVRFPAVMEGQVPGGEISKTPLDVTATVRREGDGYRLVRVIAH